MQAHRVLLQRTRAVGEAAEQHGELQEVRAAREVIVIGGADDSPQVRVRGRIRPAARVCLRRARGRAAQWPARPRPGSSRPRLPARSRARTVSVPPFCRSPVLPESSDRHSARAPWVPAAPNLASPAASLSVLLPYGDEGSLTPL